jgi:hypothetical protein
MDATEERVTDEATKEAARKTAKTIHYRALVLAAVVTAGVLLFP